MSSKKANLSQEVKNPSSKLKNVNSRLWNSQPIVNTSASPQTKTTKNKPKQSLLTKTSKQPENTNPQQLSAPSSPSRDRQDLTDPISFSQEDSQNTILLEESITNSSLGSLPPEKTPTDESSACSTLRSILSQIPYLADKFNITIKTLLSKEAGSRDTGKLLAQEVLLAIENLVPQLQETHNHITSLEQSLIYRDEDLAQAREDLRNKEVTIQAQESLLQNVQHQPTYSQALASSQGIPTSSAESTLVKKSDLGLIEAKINALSNEVSILTRSLKITPLNNQQLPTEQDLPEQSLQQPLNDHGVVLLAPIHNDPSWSSRTKTILNNLDFQDPGVSVRDSRRGHIIVKSTASSSISKIKTQLSNHPDILKSSSLSSKGPILTTLVIKGLPSPTTAETIKNSLSNMGSNYSIIGRKYPYKKSDSFTQVIQMETALAKAVLSAPKPSIKVGLCSHPVELFVPFARCRTCQAFGHSTQQCEQNYYTCGYCARQGHSSDQCRQKNSLDQHYCINCHDFNDHHPIEEHLDPYHATSSKSCQAFKIFINQQLEDYRYRLFNNRQYYK